MNPWAIVLGLTLGLGLLLMAASLPALRRDVRVRIAPFVADVSAGAFAFVEQTRAQQGVLRTARRLVERFGPSGSELDRMMRRAVRAGGASRARIELGLAALIGLGAGSMVALLAGGPVLIRLMLPLLFAVAGGWLWLQLLLGTAKRRCARIERELPTVLEFLSLCVASGEALPDAIARISRVGSGELVAELAEVTRLSQLGVPLTTALDDLARALGITALSRLTAQLRSALERGSPLGDVLKAQAADQRVEFKRELLESAGRKEIAMMLPLVFLILPITVLFAVWPGLIAFNTGFLP